MSHDLTRQDLKRNELSEALGKSVHFAEEHLKSIIGIAIAAVAIAFLTWGVWSWRVRRADTASEMLGQALRIANAPIVETDARPDDSDRPSFASQEERDRRAQELFTSLADDYGSTGAGQGARVWLGEQALNRGDAEAARKLWTEALASRSEGAFSAAARIDLAELDRAEGRGEELAAELSRELESGRGPLPTDVLLAELARTYESLSRDDEARSTWQRLVDEHPDSAYAATAREQLAANPVG